jgi:prephenate dehydrogenase
MNTDTSASRALIAIVGLDTVGVAMARALQRVKTNYNVVGHDADPDRAREARATGAIDQTEWNLIHAVENADLVMISEPLDKAIATLEAIAPHVKPGALVTDMGTVKSEVLAAADRLLPAHASFVGSHPVLREGESPLSGATFCVMPSPSASDEAVRVLTQLVRAVGAEPYFIDPFEHDSLATAVSTLPFVLSSSLVRLIGDSASVRDLKRLAPAEFVALADGAMGGAHERAALSANAAPIVAWIDGLIDTLAELRIAIATGDQAALQAWIDAAEGAGEAWDSAAEPEHHSAAIDELKNRNIVSDTLFGRLGRRS